jgi:beta-hydroxylase
VSPVSEIAGQQRRWRRPSFKSTRRVTLACAVLAPAIYFVPIPTMFYLLCGALDISRQRKVTSELLQKYFMGNGILTWCLSPINLLLDAFSHRNRLVYRLEDLPADHRNEIETCVRAFIAHGDLIKAHVAKRFSDNKRCMLTFKWYDKTLETDIKIPEFERRYRHIKTIAVSAFNTRERTSRHFGPLRMTFRVLYNLEPVASRDVFIEADDTMHLWSENPLFIFDDTIFHRSVNDVDQPRYCLFMDIVRPNYFPRAFDIAIQIPNAVLAPLKHVFYKHWSFIR